MSEARKTFSFLTKGILNIIRSADLYQVHLLAKRAHVEPDKNLVEAIMSGDKISGSAISSQFYTKEDFEFLEQNGHLREIGQQTILSIYTAIEIYLIEKFKEYYRHRTSSCEKAVAEESLKLFSFRSLEEIKKRYNKVLDINLPSFETNFKTEDKSSFRPKSSWEAIVLLSDARNDIAHKGHTNKLAVNNLLDVWYPFDFSRKWVKHFDNSFDRFEYEKSDKLLRKTYLPNLPKKSHLTKG